MKKAARECAERRAATKGGKKEQKRGFCRGKRERRKLKTSAFAQEGLRRDVLGKSVERETEGRQACSKDGE